MAAEVAKLKLKQHPIKTGNAYKITLENGISDWIPKSTVMGYTPATLTIEIEIWILLRKNIPFKL